MKKEEEKVKSRYGTVNFEKRKHPRFDVNLPVEYTRSDWVATNHGQVHNASEGGLLLYLPEKMEIGQYLMLKLFFPLNAELKTINTLVKVVWMDFHLGENRKDFRAGVKFVDILPGDVEKLRNFLKSLSGETI